jgi:methionyl aminopeptidase
VSVLTAGRVSAERPVPRSIERPEYVGQIAPLPYKGPLVRDADTIAAMRIADG